MGGARGRGHTTVPLSLQASPWQVVVARALHAGPVTTDARVERPRRRGQRRGPARKREDRGGLPDAPDERLRGGVFKGQRGGAGKLDCGDGRGVERVVARDLGGVGVAQGLGV